MTILIMIYTTMMINTMMINTMMTTIWNMVKMQNIVNYQKLKNTYILIKIIDYQMLENIMKKMEIFMMCLVRIFYYITLKMVNYMNG